MASNPASVTASDRLTFTVFLAVAFHGILIFGVSFAPELQRAAPHTLEVTLAQHRSDSEPEEADFIAQSNQEGSGDQADKQELTTTDRQILPTVNWKTCSSRRKPPASAGSGSASNW